MSRRGRKGTEEQQARRALISELRFYWTCAELPGGFCAAIEILRLYF